MLDSSDASVARGATSIYFSSIVLLLANTAYFATITNLLPTSQIGVITGLQIIIFGVATIANLSLPQTVLTNMPLPPAVAKLIPDFLSSGRRGKAVQVFRASLTISIALSTASSLILFFSAGWIVDTVFQGQAASEWIALASIDVWFYTIGQLFMMTLVGLNRTAKAGIYYTLSFMVRYFLAIGLVVLGIGVAGVLTAWIVSDVVMVIICAINLGSIARGPTERLSHTEVLRYSVPVVVSSVVVFGVTQIDKLFALGRFTLSELGIYNVAVAASLIAAFAPNAISLALLPRLSALFTQDSRQTFLILARKYTRYVSLIAIPMSFQIAALSKPLTQLFGAQYIQAATSAAIISAVMGVTVISSIHNASLLASQNAGRVMRANILGLTTFAIFMLTLSPFLGFEVLAWSRATMIIVITLVIELYAYKRGFLVIDWRAYISSLTAATVMGIILMLIVNTVGGYLRLIALLPVLIFLGILIYFSILRLIKTFNNDDMDFVKSLLPQRLGFLVNWAAKVMGVKLTQTEKD